MTLDDKAWAKVKEHLRGAFTREKFIADIGYVAWWVDGDHVGATPLGEWFSDKEGRELLFQDGSYGLFDTVGEEQMNQCEKEVLGAIGVGRSEGAVTCGGTVVQWLLVEEREYDRWAQQFSVTA